MADSPIHMWSYWRDDQGMERALEDFFPELLESDPELNFAYQQYKVYKARINQIMEDKVDDDADAWYN